MKFIAICFFFLLISNVKALTVGAYNIRNFDYDERFRISTDKVKLSQILKNVDADVLSVEEINDTKAWFDFVEKKLPEYDTQLSNCGGDHGQRLGFLYKVSKVELLDFHEDLSTSNSCHSGSRPVAIALFKIKQTNQKFYALAAHLKSGGRSSSIDKRRKQFYIIKNLIQELKYKTGIEDFFLAGDLNTTSYLSRGADYKNLNRVMNELGMMTLSADLKCSSYYWGGTDDGIETPSLLDHVIVTPGLVKRDHVEVQSLGHCQIAQCQEVSIEVLGRSYEKVSDHCPVIAEIQ